MTCARFMVTSGSRPASGSRLEHAVGPQNRLG
jgi:hypothetical protein